MAHFNEEMFSQDLERKQVLSERPKYEDDLGVIFDYDVQVERVAVALITARDQSKKNRFELSIEEQLKRFRAANKNGKWGFTEEDFKRLSKTAPAWPEENSVFRSLRIRLGEGSEGVARTFEAHAEEAKRVNDPNFWRYKKLCSEPEHLRLLFGDDTHHAGVEWIIFDANTHRYRRSIVSVRSNKSLADELIVAMWMFPEFIKAIDFSEFFGMYAGGYEYNVRRPCDESHEKCWDKVPIIYFSHKENEVSLSVGWRISDDLACSVPSLWEEEP